jgi:hypothetical protein
LGQQGDEAPQSGRAAFGLSLLTDLRLPGAWTQQPLREPSLQISLATPTGIHDAWSGLTEVAWEAVIDGAPFVVERGAGGDHRFIHGAPPDQRGLPSAQTMAIHHLCADASILSCAPSNEDDPSWWRVVLDSALFTVALLQGYEALHAGAIATPDGVIAVTAAAGGGKSTLLAELLGRGWKLMADDVLVLAPQEAAPPIAHPGPPLMTVPVSRLGILDTNSTKAISTIDDECWIAVPVHSQPLPLKALVLLDRRPESELSTARPSMTRIESPLAPLLDSLIGFPATPKRQRARFELASDLASTAGLWLLTAELDTPPEALADTLLAATGG